MKLKIFSRGKGWYIPCSNYRDENDKTYLNIYFAYHDDPQYIDNGRGFSCKDIDVSEGKFTSYQGKVGLTIFKYELLSDIEVNESNMKNDDYQPPIQTPLNNGESDMFGRKNAFDDEDLPFL